MQALPAVQDVFEADRVALLGPPGGLELPSPGEQRVGVVQLVGLTEEHFLRGKRRPVGCERAVCVRVEGFGVEGVFMAWSCSRPPAHGTCALRHTEHEGTPRSMTDLDGRFEHDESPRSMLPGHRL